MSARLLFKRLMSPSLIALSIWLVFPATPGQALGTLTVSSATISESNFNAATASATLNFILSAAATADVTINFNNDGECQLKDNGGSFKTSGALIITSGNSSVSSTVKAVNDEQIEGQHSCKFSFHSASSDVQFNGINKIHSVTINDNDGLPSLNIVVIEASHLKEGNLSFRNVYSVVRGDEEPTSAITLTVWTDNQCALRKTSGSGYTSQISQEVQSYVVPIYVVANDDEIAEGDHTCQVQHLIHTSDPAYKDNLVDSRFITIVDNDGSPPANQGGTNSNTADTSVETVTAADKQDEDQSQFVGQSGGSEPIRLHDPDAVNNVFIIMIVSAVIVGTILGWWRYGAFSRKLSAVDKS